MLVSMFSQDWFENIYILLILSTELIRLPYYLNTFQRRRQAIIIPHKPDWKDRFLFFLVIMGIWAVPILKMRTTWFSVFNYQLPAIARSFGILIYLLGTALLIHAHHQLNQNWSPAIELNTAQVLVTTGIYRWIRHPIYAAIWLMVFAQSLLVTNWLAGFSGIITFFFLYHYRIRKEEKVLMDYFGEAYLEYSLQTGRLVPILLLKKFNRSYLFE